MNLFALIYYTIKTRCTFYLKTGLLIIAYAVLYQCRITEDFFKIYNTDNQALIISKSVARVVLSGLWLALYFFIFEIERINMTLNAKNFSDYKISLKRKGRTNMIIWIIYLVCSIVYVTLYILELFKEEMYKNYKLINY